MQLRYVKCQACGHCDKSMIPAEYVYRRSFISK